MSEMKIYLPNGSYHLIDVIFQTPHVLVGSEGDIKLDKLPPQAYCITRKKKLWGESKLYLTPFSSENEVAVLKNGLPITEVTQIVHNDKISCQGETLCFDLSIDNKRFSLANKVLSLCILFSTILVAHQFYYYQKYDSIWAKIETDFKSDIIDKIPNQIEASDDISRLLIFSPVNDIRVKLIGAVRRHCPNDNLNYNLECQLFCSKHLLIFESDLRKKAEYARDTQCLRSQIDFLLPATENLKLRNISAALNTINLGLKRYLEDETLLTVKASLESLNSLNNKNWKSQVNQLQKDLEPYPYLWVEVNKLLKKNIKIK